MFISFKDIRPLFYVVVGVVIGGMFAGINSPTTPIQEPHQRSLVLNGKGNQNQNKLNRFLDFSPKVKTVVINVGSNLDPILPRKEDGPCAKSIAFEPMVGCQIEEHPQLNVVHAAVSSNSGLTGMRFYNRNGLSSSLSVPSTKEAWADKNKNKKYGKLSVVPLVSMHDVLSSIPPSVNIQYLQTDMQGHDFDAISSVGFHLAKRGIAYIKTEIWVDDTVSYEGVQNDLCRDWLPYMTKIGYVLDSLRTANPKKYSSPAEAERVCNEVVKNSAGKKRPQKVGRKEGDAYWRLKTVQKPFDFEYLRLNKRTTLHFTPEEYEQCN